jgi:hypothetical protein
MASTDPMKIRDSGVVASPRVESPFATGQEVSIEEERARPARAETVSG